MVSAVSFAGEGVSLAPGSSVSVPAAGVSLQADVSLHVGVSILPPVASGDLIELEDSSGTVLLETGTGYIQLES